jgi:hypothetical protein
MDRMVVQDSWGLVAARGRRCEGEAGWEIDRSWSIPGLQPLALAATRLRAIRDLVPVSYGPSALLDSPATQAQSTEETGMLGLAE